MAALAPVIKSRKQEEVKGAIESYEVGSGCTTAVEHSQLFVPASCAARGSACSCRTARKSKEHQF
jgi:hypothetical protein